MARVLVRRVEVGFVAARAAYGRFGVIRHDDSRHPAEELEGSSSRKKEVLFVVWFELDSLVSATALSRSLGKYLAKCKGA